MAFSSIKSITLKILASDIKSTHYLDFQDCAITRALKRAGYEDFRDNGIEIGVGRTGAIDFKNFHDLSSKVKRMYLNPETAEDFEFTLIDPTYISYWSEDEEEDTQSNNNQQST